MGKEFHICTLVSKKDQYEQMKKSLLAAGFDEDRCRYTVLDNSSGNNHEPYSAINWQLDNTKEKYLIFCHQDLIFDQGHGIDELLRLIDDIAKDNPRWAILGNAGMTDTLAPVIRLSDSDGFHDVGPCPSRVQSLDENFLVFKSGTTVRCSKEISGFHLYGTDLCLNASLKKLTCHVIDFHLTHLSSGNLNEDFYKIEEALRNLWNHRFTFFYVGTCCTCFFLSKHAFLREIFGTKRMIGRVNRRRKFYVAAVFASKILQGERPK